VWVKDLHGGAVTFYLLDVEEIAFSDRISWRKRLYHLTHLARNFGRAVAPAQIDASELGLRWARAYQEASGIQLPAGGLEQVKAFAFNGMHIERKESAAKLAR
jgi:hypothetical protein